MRTYAYAKLAYAYVLMNMHAYAKLAYAHASICVRKPNSHYRFFTTNSDSSF